MQETLRLVLGGICLALSVAAGLAAIYFHFSAIGAVGMQEGSSTHGGRGAAYATPEGRRLMRRRLFASLAAVVLCAAAMALWPSDATQVWQALLRGTEP